MFKYYISVFFWGGDQREGHGTRIWPNKHKMELISEYLAADTSPDASADALAIINVGKFKNFKLPIHGS